MHRLVEVHLLSCFRAFLLPPTRCMKTHLSNQKRPEDRSLMEKYQRPILPQWSFDTDADRNWDCCFQRTRNNRHTEKSIERSLLLSREYVKMRMVDVPNVRHHHSFHQQSQR